MTNNSSTFQYGKTETDHLSAQDKKLAAIIGQIGHIEREVRPNLFSALMRTIIGQQISTKAQQTIWNRLVDFLPEITTKAVSSSSIDDLQKLGLSFRKVGYMQNVANQIVNGNLDLDSLTSMSDSQVCETLCELKGIGIWTAEMLMIFSMQRSDILSFGDLAIIRGLKMLYGHESITPELFKQYKQSYSPYASVASLYLWEVAGGAIPELQPKPQESKAMNNIKNKKKQNIAQETSAIYTTELGNIEIRSDGQFITHVHFSDKHPTVDDKDNSTTPLIDKAAKQIKEYFAGDRQQFDLPIKQPGTDFQQSVWTALQNIPYGETVSYKRVAEQVNNPKASRAIGMANNKNKIAIIVPCHRVIGANGKLVGYAGGLHIKAKLLKIENNSSTY